MDKKQEENSPWTMAHAMTMGEMLAFVAFCLWLVFG